MSKQNSNNQTSKGTRSVTVVNCAVPIAVFVFLVGGMGVWFARSSKQPSITQVASQMQPTSTNQEKVTIPPDVAVTLTPAPKNWQETTHVHGLAVNSDNPEIISLRLITGCFSAPKPESGSGWEKKGLTTWALLLTPRTQTAFTLMVTHPQAAI